MSMFPLRRTHLLSPAGIGALLASVLLSLSLSLSLSLPAQQQPSKELSDKVAEQLSAIVKKITEDPRDEAGALNDINRLLAEAKPDSYDVAQLSQLKAQAYINLADYASSVAPLETVHRLAKAYGYFNKEQELGVLWTLAQIYVQDAGSEKNVEIQKGKLVKALAAVREWLASTPKPTYEAYQVAASILYQQAITGKEPDKELLKQAEIECLNALTTAIKPRDQLYQLLVAIAQTNNDLATASKYLELMVEANPKSGGNWTMLLGSYLMEAEAMPDGSTLRNETYAKAVYTILRAQKNGFMSAPQDYQRLFACFFNSSQYEGAIDVLEDGLRNGKVEDELKNWELLSGCYVQINQTQKAIDTLVEASRKPAFKDRGDIDMQIGYLYYGMEQHRKALDFMKVARDKGVVPTMTAKLLFFIGYLHYELKELDEALVSVTKSLELKPDDQSAKDILGAVKSSITDRDRNLMREQPAASGTNQPQAGPKPAQPPVAR